jgi:anti-anti-sigma regulatory factor/PAS domain-containing protein
MLTTLVAIIVLIVETALATFVASRAWQLRPSRIYIYLAASVMLVVVAAMLRDVATMPEAAYPAMAALIVGVSCYLLLLLLLISALFTPEWWEGQRPIVWIAAPYVLVTAFIAGDVFGRLGLVVTGATFADIYRLTYAQPAGGILLALSLAGQIVCLVILAFAYFNPRQRQFRLVIALLIGAIVASLVVSSLAGRFTVIARLVTLVQTVPVLAVFAYAILGTRLFMPTRTALNLALRSLREAVAVVNETGVISYSNPSATALGIVEGAPLPERIGTIAGAGALVQRLMNEHGGDLGLRSGDQHLELTATPVRDKRGAQLGTLLLARDVSEIAERNRQIERERSQLAATVDQLERSQQQRESLAATVRSLSLPLIPVLPGVLILPLVGDFDGARINEFIGVLLEGIERQQASTVLIDITGLPLLDTAGAQGLLTGVRAAALLGARCVLVGVRPEVAQSIVSLGLALDELITAPTLEQAVLQRLKGGFAAPGARAQA